MTPPIRLLLVEDDAATARLVGERLHDVQELELVATVSTLAEAIASAATQHPAIVFLDLGLPDSDGVETIAAFRDAHPRLPVVVLSNLDDVDVAMDAMRHGAQEYLVKGHVDTHTYARAARSAIERKRLQELEQMMVGVVSHDLRGPLQAITIACELAAIEATPPVLQKIERALESAQRATRLVNDLLDATRARLTSLLPVSTATTDLVKTVETVVQEHALASGREIHLESPVTLLAVVDATRIAQVVGNLLGNAIQHSDDDTPVNLLLRVDAAHIELNVHNEGPAIPETLRGKLFEPLERAQMVAERRATHSIGLGLYIVSEIVRAHGGTIDVFSAPNSGTTFRVRLPKPEHDAGSRI
ncbi:MAG: hybrid sensor histidine kinase/response regulator [Kofleriaceae bacterium]